MSDVDAVSVCPTNAIPEIEGLPVAASFSAVTLMVIVYVTLSDTPSLTLNVKLA